MLSYLYEAFCTHWRILLGLYILQGIVGVLVFEWFGWKKTERIRLGQPEMYAEFPSFRRLDSHMWSRWNFYPGCFLIMIPRVIFLLTVFFGPLAIGIALLYGSHKNFEKPLSGWRATVWKFLVRTISHLICIGFGYMIKHTEHTEDDTDYSRYLGPNWKENKFIGKRVSTLVSNHISFLDIWSWCAVDEIPAFAPQQALKDMFIGHHICGSVQCIYIDRDQNKEGLDKTVNLIIERQKLIETDDLNWGPICVFAEGSVTNGKNLARFRRGAFASGLAVQPGILKYKYATVGPDYATLKGLELGLMQCAEFALNTIYSHRYPIFVPNDYLYTVYAKTIPGYEKMEKWEIYAHAVNDFMRREGQYEHCTQANREKVSLQKFVWGLKDEITVNGKTFYWPPRTDSLNTKKDN